MLDLTDSIAELEKGKLIIARVDALLDPSKNADLMRGCMESRQRLSRLITKLGHVLQYLRYLERPVTTERRK